VRGENGGTPASLLWPLGRANAIESGLFKIQAKQLLQFRQRRQAHQNRKNIIGSLFRDVVATEDYTRQNEIDPVGGLDVGSQSTLEPADVKLATPVHIALSRSTQAMGKIKAALILKFRFAMAIKTCDTTERLSKCGALARLFRAPGAHITKCANMPSATCLRG
jgi:hypothetical protein